MENQSDPRPPALPPINNNPQPLVTNNDPKPPAPLVTNNDPKPPAPPNAVNVNSNANNTINVKSIARPHFAYTQGSFWQGPNADYTTLAVLACIPFTGFMGLDHLYLRSPATAVAKAVLNIFSLGLWYFYDLAQVLGERDRIKEIGYSMPLVGQTGLGAGIFPKSEAELTVGPSPWRFIVYAVAALIPLPFGQDFFAAGDIPGGIAKLFTVGAPILWLFGLIWGFVVIFRLFFQTEALITEGPPRFFPFTLFMDDYKCSRGILGPDRECGDQEAHGGLFAGALKFLRGLPIVGRLVEPVEQTVKVAAQTAKAVSERVIPPVVAAGTAAVTAGAEVVTTLPKVANNIADQAKAFTSAEGLKSQITMSGGSRATDGVGIISLIVLVAGMVGSGVLFAKVKDLEFFDALPSLPLKRRQSPGDVPPTYT